MLFYILQWASYPFRLPCISDSLVTYVIGLNGKWRVGPCPTSNVKLTNLSLSLIQPINAFNVLATHLGVNSLFTRRGITSLAPQKGWLASGNGSSRGTVLRVSYGISHKFMSHWEDFAVSVTKGVLLSRQSQCQPRTLDTYLSGPPSWLRRGV